MFEWIWATRPETMYLILVQYTAQVAAVFVVECRVALAAPLRLQM